MTKEEFSKEIRLLGEKVADIMETEEGELEDIVYNVLFDYAFLSEKLSGEKAKELVDFSERDKDLTFFHHAEREAIHSLRGMIVNISSYSEILEIFAKEIFYVNIMAYVKTLRGIPGYSYPG